jgi:hypothetical protein
VKPIRCMMRLPSDRARVTSTPHLARAALLVTLLMILFPTPAGPTVQLGSVPQLALATSTLLFALLYASRPSTLARAILDLAFIAGAAEIAHAVTSRGGHVSHFLLNGGTIVAAGVISVPLRVGLATLSRRVLHKPSLANALVAGVEQSASPSSSRFDGGADNGPLKRPNAADRRRK